jgi:hypothetical protein
MFVVLGMTVKVLAILTKSFLQNMYKVLYTLSYIIKMSHKKGIAPTGFFDYVVYPLEGIWNIKTKEKVKDKIDKNNLIFKLMIRKIDFVDKKLATLIIKQKVKNLISC